MTNGEEIERGEREESGRGGREEKKEKETNLVVGKTVGISVGSSRHVSRSRNVSRSCDNGRSCQGTSRSHSRSYTVCNLQKKIYCTYKKSYQNSIVNLKKNMEKTTFNILLN